MAIVGYIRVSTDKQNYDGQKLSILNYANDNLKGRVAEQATANKTGEAYTENHAGRRGGRAPRRAGTASKWQLRTPRVLTCTEGNTEASVLARMWRSAGVIRPWHA